jgi:hypothetical protein
MKKRILLAIGLIATFAVFAAGQSASSSGSTDSSAPAAAQPVASPDQSAPSQETTQQTTQETTTKEASSVASDSAVTSAQTTTTVTGTVRTYEVGKSVTLVRPDGSTVTYTVNSQSQLPTDVAVGKKVTITTTSVTGEAQPVVQTMTYSKKVTTKKKVAEPQK